MEGRDSESLNPFELGSACVDSRVIGAMLADARPVVLVFDFDETIIPCNSDTHVPLGLEPTSFRERLDSFQKRDKSGEDSAAGSWTAFMNDALEDLARRGYSERDLRRICAGVKIDNNFADALKDVCSIPGFIQRCIVCSDANEFFIREILIANYLYGRDYPTIDEMAEVEAAKAAEASEATRGNYEEEAYWDTTHIFKTIITNGSKFVPCTSEGNSDDSSGAAKPAQKCPLRLAVTPYTECKGSRPHECRRGCPRNLCKTDALRHRIKELGTTYIRHEKWLLECEKVAFEKIREEDGLSSDDEEDEEEDEQRKEEKRKQKQQREEEQRKADKQEKENDDRELEDWRRPFRFVYVGDGGNDFCPCASFSRDTSDIVLARAGCRLAERIRSDPSAVAATVIEWEDWTELAIHISALKHAFFHIDADALTSKRE